MQFTTIDSTLRRQAPTGFNDASTRPQALDHLPALQRVECLLDLLTASVSFAIAYRIFDFYFARGSIAYSQRLLAGADLLLSCLVVILLDRTGAYRPSGGLLRIRETASILQAVFWVFVVLVPSTLVVGRRDVGLFLVCAVPLLTFLLIAQKHITHSIIDAYRQRGFGLRRVLIYGAGETGRRLFSALSRSPKLGLSPVAIIDDGSGFEGLEFHESCYRRKHSLISMTGEFCSSLLSSHHADVVFIAGRLISEEGLQTIIDESEKAGVTTIFAADSTAGESESIDYLELDGHLVYSLHKPCIRSNYDLASRLLDLAVSATLLILTSPLFALISILITIDSAGPVLFRQQRVGKGGRLFTIYKFRSMHAHSCGDGVSPATAKDPRITRVGRWLRKTSLDELPQLLNILQGDMALVGPRPEMPFIVAQYTQRERERLAVRPGLTGLWQISADRSRPIHENIQYDFYYLKHRSVFIDFAILVHTAMFAMNGT